MNITATAMSAAVAANAKGTVILRILTSLSKTSGHQYRRFESGTTLCNWDSHQAASPDQPPESPRGTERFEEELSDGRANENMIDHGGHLIHVLSTFYPRLIHV